MIYTYIIYIEMINIYIYLSVYHQYLLSSSCHPFYCKKGVPYSQALRLNRICSNNVFLDKRCNDLEKYLLERAYSEKMARKKIAGEAEEAEAEQNSLQHNIPSSIWGS